MCEVGHMGQSGHNITTQGPRRLLSKLTNMRSSDVILYIVIIIITL